MGLDRAGELEDAAAASDDSAECSLRLCFQKYLLTVEKMGLCRGFGQLSGCDPSLGQDLNPQELLADSLYLAVGVHCRTDRPGQSLRRPLGWQRL